MYMTKIETFNISKYKIGELFRDKGSVVKKNINVKSESMPLWIRVFVKARLPSIDEVPTK